MTNPSMGVPNLPNNPKGMTDPISRQIKLTITMGWPTPLANGSGWRSNLPILMTYHLKVFMGFTWGPLIHLYIEITWVSRPKTLPHSQITYTWRGDPKYLGILLSTRKFPRIKGFRSALYHYINHKPYPSWGTQILPNSCTLKFLEILLSLIQPLEGLWPVPPGALWLVFLFCSSGTPIGTCVDD